MSNLGLYQTMTTVAKKVGGPVNFLLLVGVAGYGICRLGEAGVKKIVQTVKDYSEQKKIMSSELYMVHSPGESNEGLHFNLGDTYRVLEVDGDAVLIEKTGENNNPYFVSAELLRDISNYDL